MRKENEKMDITEKQIVNAQVRENKITAEQLRIAMEELNRYKADKEELEARILDEYKWWKMRHWEAIGDDAPGKPKPVSAWMFNVIANKHADAMDNYPEPNVLPRVRDDEEDARALSSILPCILERNEFEETYSRGWDYKLRHGFAAYGVVWNNDLDDGLGDVCVKTIDALNIFWEKGVSDIQNSRNLFIISLVDTDILEQTYPHLKDGFAKGTTFDIKKYEADVDLSKKSLVIEWYYKVRSRGKTIVHYVKFSGESVIYATENDEQLRDKGLYDHGQYPVVLDVLYPEAGSCAGLGMIAITKSPQLYIDKLDSVLLENAVLHAKPRYFTSNADGINESEFLDFSNPLVHVEGDVSENRLRAIDVPSVSQYAMNMLEYKIREMKETSSNNDATAGSVPTGITSGAAISALQEAGNKQSRDMILSSYRAYTKMCYMIIELIRQFYDENRYFRILGEGGEYKFISYSNKNLKTPLASSSYIGQEMTTQLGRKPVFDIKIKPQKKSAYSKLSQNSLAQEFYQMGFFNPELATQSLACIEMMDFDGKEKIKAMISQGNTMQMQLQALMQENTQLKAILQNGAAMPNMKGIEKINDESKV